MRGRGRGRGMSSGLNKTLPPKLRNQNANVFTRQTRHKNSPTTGANNGLLLDLPITTTGEDGSVVWSTEAEIFLFKEMINHKLSGKLLSIRFGTKISVQSVLEHVNTLFDTKRLEDNAEPLKIEEIEFSLPKSFNLLKEKRKEASGDGAGTTSITSTSGKTKEKDSKSERGDEFVSPTPPHFEKTLDKTNKDLLASPKKRTLSSSSTSSNTATAFSSSGNTTPSSNNETSSALSSSPSFKDKAKDVKTIKSTSDLGKSKDRDSVHLKGKGKNTFKFGKEQEGKTLLRSSAPSSVVQTKKRRI